MSWIHAKRVAIVCGLACLAWGGPAAAQETNPFGDAPKAAAPAEPPASEPAPAEAAAPAEPPAASPAPAPATPAGAKSMDEYRALLRQYSAQREHQQVIDLCDEIAKVYPAEDLKFFRTRAEQSLRDDAARKTSHFQRIKEKPLGTPAAGAATRPAEPVESASPAPTEPEATEAPATAAAKLPPPPDAPVSEPASGGGMKKILAIVLVVAGVAIIGAVVMLGMNKKKSASTPASRAKAQNHGRRGSDAPPQSAPSDFGQPSGFEMQPVSYGAQPDVFGLEPEGSAPEAEQAFAPPSASPTEDDIFGSIDAALSKPSSPKPAPAAPKPAPGGFSDSDIFSIDAIESAPTAKPSRPAASPPPAAQPAPASAQKEDSDLFALFEGVYEAPKKQSAPGPQPAASEEISFDFSAPAKTPAAKGETPWGASDGGGDIPALPMEAFGVPTPSVSGPPAWETSTKTKTGGKPATTPPPSFGDDDLSSLPLLSDSPGPSFSMSKPEAAVTQGFGSTGTKPAAKFPDPPAAEKPAPAFAEMSLKSLRGPENSETIGAFEPISFGGETNPGFEMPLPGKSPAKDLPPIKFGDDDEFSLPALDASSVPDMPFEQTMRMSAKELAEDPDLILESHSHEGKQAPSPGMDKLKLFKADETVSVDLADSSSSLFAPGTFGGAPKAAPRAAAPPPPSAPPVETPGESFDQERELGMAAFRDAEWEKAVYHLSIAAALRPEATDIKEHLRRARRMRKEKEG